MPRITSKGQITIPREIRDRFSLLPGTEVDVISDGSKVLIVKSRSDDAFVKWVGRGKRLNRQRIDTTIDQLRGRTNG